MIPFDRKEQNRQGTEVVSNKDSNNDQQSKIKEKDINEENSSEEISNDQPLIEKNIEHDEYV